MDAMRLFKRSQTPLSFGKEAISGLSCAFKAGNGFPKFYAIALSS